jgi:hypothetical protein
LDNTNFKNLLNQNLDIQNLANALVQLYGANLPENPDTTIGVVKELQIKVEGNHLVATYTSRKTTEPAETNTTTFDLVLTKGSLVDSLVTDCKLSGRVTKQVNNEPVATLFESENGVALVSAGLVDATGTPDVFLPTTGYYNVITFGESEESNIKFALTGAVSSEIVDISGKTTFTSTKDTTKLKFFAPEKGLKLTTIYDVTQNAHETVTVTPELKLDEEVLTQDNKPEGSTLEYSYTIKNEGITTLPAGLNFSNASGVITGSYEHNLKPLFIEITATLSLSSTNILEVTSNEFSIEIDALEFKQEIGNVTFQYNSLVQPTPNLKNCLEFMGEDLPASANVTFGYYGTQPNLNGLSLNSETGQISGTLDLSEMPSNSFSCAISARYSYGGHDYMEISNSFTITIVPNTQVTVAMDNISNQNLKIAESTNIPLPTVTSILDVEENNVTNQCDVTYTLTPNLPAGLDFNAENHNISGIPTIIKSGTTEYTYTATVSGKYSATKVVKFYLAVKLSAFEPTLQNHGANLINNEVTIAVKDATGLSIKPTALFNSNSVAQENLTMELKSGSLPEGVSIENNCISGSPIHDVSNGLEQIYPISVTISSVVNTVSFSQTVSFDIKVVNVVKIAYNTADSYKNVNVGTDNTLQLTSFTFNGLNMTTSFGLYDYGTYK